MSDETLIEELKSALAHLHDPSFLEMHPLAGRIGYCLETADLSTGQRLRRALRLGIEALNPGNAYPPHVPEARPYQVMRQYYVARREMSRISLALSISERQCYRELRRGVEALAQVLFATPPQTAEPEGQAAIAPESPQINQIREEVERVHAGAVEHLDLAELLLSAQSSVASLAECQGVRMNMEVSDGLAVSANRVMLRQALINVLSYVLGMHRGPDLNIRLAQEGDDALLTIFFEPDPGGDTVRPAGPRSVAKQLFALIDGEFAEESLEDGRVLVRVRFHLSEKHSLLIVDDYAGVAQLLRSYLRGQPYTIHAVTDPTLALDMVEELAPDVVILDVMMPDLDGWEFLERVRQTPTGRKVAVIISSVINDPELAYALGADAFLHKPLDRSSLLQALSDTLSSTT